MHDNKIIEYIQISKLHGYKNIKINFDSPYMILLSENGQGKSTILRIIKNCLNLELLSLQDIKFDSIEIKFSQTNDIALLKKLDLDFEYSSRAYEYLSERLSKSDFNHILNLINSKKSYSSIISYTKNISSTTKINIPSMAIRELIEDRDKLLNNVGINNFREIIQKNFNKEILYLPTYRRIEQLMEEFEESKIKDKNIQFGLRDVKVKIEEIRTNILSSSNNTMSRINSEILKRLINGLEVNDEELKIIKENKDHIDLLLNRFGNDLTEEDKIKIKNLISSIDNLNDRSSQNTALFYFISKMFNGFFEQREKDQALKKFAEICSGYFINKTMKYNETSINISINSNDELSNLSEIQLEDLSSGEKQIVSLFSKLILDQEKEYFILFDEPELSLSVEWQKKLLKDVLNSNSCHLLLCMTHSPFIYDELEEITYDLSDFFLPTNMDEI